MNQSEKTKITREDFNKLKTRLKKDGIATCVVMSGSMAPALKVGERMLVSPVLRRLKMFDVIVFFQDSILVSHCFIKFARNPDPGTKLLTQALIGKSFDRPVNEEDVLGVVTSHRLSFPQKFRLFLRQFWQKN
jgi:signal peptidase I